jgi:hypothetical protein
VNAASHRWPIPVRLARDWRRIALLLAIRLAIGEFGVVTGFGAGGTVGAVLLVVGGLVVLYTSVLALFLVTVTAEVVPAELHVVWPLRRSRYRLRPGSVTRLRTRRRGGLFSTELGGLGIEFGSGHSDGEEPLSVIRLDPRVPLNLVPTEGRRVAIAVADETAFVQALTDATRRPTLRRRDTGGPPHSGVERSRSNRDRMG